MAEPASFFTDGDAYDRMMGQWSRAVGEVFLDWLALPKGLRWLDVGCGTGAFTNLISDRCGPAAVSGIDPSADQIKFAQALPGAKRAAFHVGDSQALPFADGEFDVAVMALVISFVPDPVKAKREMRRVVKRGGTVAGYMWDFIGGGLTQWPFRKSLEAIGIDLPMLPGYENSRMERMKEIMTESGLVDVVGREIKIEVSYPNFEQYWDAQTGLANPTIQRIRTLTPPELQKFKDHLRANVPTEGSGRIAYPAWSNAVKGRVPG
jgi:ubiquinone/menaquinone biosynthesis C-methylase UbiE